MMRSMISKKVLVVLAGCLLLALGLAACGGDDDSSSSNATTAATNSATTSSAASSGSNTSAGVAVTIDNFKFSTKAVQAGESFQVENKDDTEHTFTSDDGKFDVNVPAGKTVTVDALTAGTYKFHCSIHSFMHGTLEVS
jgi:plastocyanin